MKAKVCIVISGVIVIFILVMVVLDVKDFGGWALALCILGFAILYFGTYDGVPETKRKPADNTEKVQVSISEELETNIKEDLLADGYQSYPIADVPMTLYVRRKNGWCLCYLFVRVKKATRKIRDNYDDHFWEALQAHVDDVDRLNIQMGCIVFANEYNPTLGEMMRNGTDVLPYKPIRVKAMASIVSGEGCVLLSHGKGIVGGMLYKRTEKELNELIMRNL